MNHLAANGVVILALLPLASCTDESNRDVKLNPTKVDASTTVDTGGCSAIQSAQPIPARPEAYLGAQPPTQKSVYVDDLYTLFASNCGGCHVDVGLGGFQTSRATFSQVVNQDWVDSMGYNNINTVMPPPSVGGVIKSLRPTDDPIDELQAQLQAWVNAGSPRDVFQIPAVVSDITGPYGLTADVAVALTNIGSCLPEKSLYATEATQMVAMDQKFASLTFTAPGKGTRAQQIGLPVNLSDTDLTTFDSRELAKLGVISYAPTYPQWVDADSRSMRHVRVPLGQSISFDATTQQFTIPGGTRFYRTLSQRVLDNDGNEHWRKIETQLIVSWPNLPNTVGSGAVQSLFGTYAWNENETQAILVTDPYRDGTPFRDRTVTYVSDEAKAADTLASNPKNISLALRLAHAARSYAITGSRRCMQCHLGSASKNFVLGFQPLQIARRNAGEGGEIDVPGGDELSQVSRLTDYGVITGIGSASDVVPLESSEGSVTAEGITPRTPRNNYELIAQGYMLGNCAHCHNPAGDPSLDNPSLQTVLNFMPSSTGGGIFRFSLETYSPRITRGNNVPIPYITPSLMDIDHPNEPAGGDIYWIPKCSPETGLCIYAPWRSLIYRGVDTPFTYSDDLAMFPHMPVSTQSIDSRAPRIMGDWMVSIPGVLKDPNVVEYAVRTNNVPNASPEFDSSPQPYRELKPGQTGYKAAVAAAADRLDRYHNYPAIPVTNWVYPSNLDPNPVEPPMPSRYQFSPDNFDIFDPRVLLDPQDYPVPYDAPTGIYQNGNLVMPKDNVPDHAHWEVLDLTQIPGAWAPRRPDWSDVLVSGGGTSSMSATQQTVVGLLQQATLTDDIKKLALTQFPVGLWQEQTGCDFTGIPTASSYSPPPTWMQQPLAQNQSSGSAPVYTLAPGEYVHNLICSNCHGVNADSTGREAGLLSEMTAGNANVPDLIHGIMVPSNRQAVFQSAPTSSRGTANAGTNVTLDDWAARYFAWMAMGGTKVKIPESVLAVVNDTKVVGIARPYAEPPTDANMLSTAQDLCADVLPAGVLTNVNTLSPKPSVYSFENGMFPSGAGSSELIFSNGDAMMWGQICSVDNPPPVRALRPNRWDVSNGQVIFTLSMSDFYDPTLYPANAPVLNQYGQVTVSGLNGGIPASNYFPMCIRYPDDSDPANQQLAKAWQQTQWVPKPGSVPGPVSVNCQQNQSLCANVPLCPLLDKNGNPYIHTYPDSATAGAQWQTQDLVNWTIRGAINAGFMVFTYLNAMQDQDVGPTPPFEQCSQLTQ